MITITSNNFKFLVPTDSCGCKLPDMNTKDQVGFSAGYSTYYFHKLCVIFIAPEFFERNYAKYILRTQ